MYLNAKKLRKLHNGTILAGFAGASADAFTLFERFEAKIEEFRGNLPRAAVELAKELGGDKSPSFINAVLGKIYEERYEPTHQEDK